MPGKARLPQGHRPWASTSAEEPDGAALLVEGDAVGPALRCAWGQAFQIPERNYLIERLLDTSLQSLFRFGMLKLKHQTATAFGIDNDDIGTASPLSRLQVTSNGILTSPNNSFPPCRQQPALRLLPGSPYAPAPRAAEGLPGSRSRIDKADFPTLLPFLHGALSPLLLGDAQGSR